VARNSYVHPAILEAYLDGEIPSRRTSSPEGGEERNAPAATSLERTEEAEVSALLRRRRRAARAAR
jgi:DNA topoisomerase IB